MKKMMMMILGVCLISGVFANNSTPVNSKVLSSFKETFSHAERVKWSEEKNHYVVRFTQDNVRYTVYYDELGNITNKMRIYQPSLLPENILERLQSKGDRQILGVTEISNKEVTVYFVRIEDDNYYYTIKTDNLKNYQVHEKVKKAK